MDPLHGAYVMHFNRIQQMIKEGRWAKSKEEINSFIEVISYKLGNTPLNGKLLLKWKTTMINNNKKQEMNAVFNKYKLKQFLKKDENEE